MASMKWSIGTGWDRLATAAVDIAFVAAQVVGGVELLGAVGHSAFVLPCVEVGTLHVFVEVSLFAEEPTAALAWVLTLLKMDNVCVLYEVALATETHRAYITLVGSSVWGARSLCNMQMGVRLGIRNDSSSERAARRGGASDADLQEHGRKVRVSTGGGNEGEDGGGLKSGNAAVMARHGNCTGGAALSAVH
eukprot:IDg19948t1